MGLGVREEDEVDDEEGGVEHEEGAADQHAARPHTQLETRHVVTRVMPPHHTRVASSPVVTSMSPCLAPGRDSRDYDGGQVVRCQAAWRNRRWRHNNLLDTLTHFYTRIHVMYNL